MAGKSLIRGRTMGRGKRGSTKKGRKSAIKRRVTVRIKRLRRKTMARIF